MLQRPDIVHLLMDTLYSEGSQDTYLRQNALGALQKFSLRKAAQNTMIHCDLVRWIVQCLALNGQAQHSPDLANGELSDYSLEYVTALLMNLSLRTSGKDMCERLAPDYNIVKVLSDMMEHENLQVRTHVNGTLYSILTRSSLKALANQLGMADILQYLMQNCDDTLQRQIAYIYN